ncbi:MAG: penicillin-binding protein 2 [Bacilli bacterium]|nr:penicillin-binding protein 2 [Bacilli bacterium]
MKKVRYRRNIIRRINIYLFLVFFVFIVLIFRLFQVMVLDNKKYRNKIKTLTYSIVEQDSAPRGRIYDRNYNIIVDNIAIKKIYYKKTKNVSKKEELDLAYKIGKHLDFDLSKLTNDMRKEVFLIKYPDIVSKKITKKEYKMLDERKLTVKQMEKLMRQRITDDDLKVFSEYDDKVSYLYYLMNKGYTYSEKAIKVKDIKDSEYAYISEHSDELGGFFIKNDWERVYPYGDVFRSILGSVSTSEQGLPAELKKDYLSKGYSLDDRVGLSYLEKQYEKYLKGSKNKYKVVNSHELKLIEEGKRGKDIVLTIDIKLQKEIESILSDEVLKAKNEPNTKYYNHSFVVIQDPNTGEILAMTGKKVEKENGQWKVVDYTPALLTSPMTPGSVVKAASMLVGYNTGAIKIGEYMKDECVKIASTPKKCSWRTLGYINDIDALALSSNVYQFKTAIRVAGSSYSYNMPFKIYNNAFQIYRNMYHSFGLGVKTGIDLPIESTGYTSNDETSGLLLDFVMGQFETYTPLQLSQYVSTIANGGERLKPHLLKEVHLSSEDDSLKAPIKVIDRKVLNKIDTKEEYFNRVKEGLHAVTMSSYGLGRNYIDSSHDPSGKTGTSQSFIDTDNDGKIDTETISTLFIGYAPTNNPTVTFTVTSPDSSHPNSSINYNSLVNLHITKKISNKYYEFYK